MTTFEKMIKSARRTKGRSRWFLAFAIAWVALCIVPVRYLNERVPTFTLTQNLIALVSVILLFLIPTSVVARWAKAPMRAVGCPACGNARMFPKRPETFLAGPDNFRSCPKCGVDLRATEWQEKV